jgi:hypothetical protein
LRGWLDVLGGKEKRRRSTKLDPDVFYRNSVAIISHLYPIKTVAALHCRFPLRFARRLLAEAAMELRTLRRRGPARF